MEDKKTLIQSLPIPRLILKYAIPTILSSLVVLIYSLGDPFFVRHTNDPAEIAALTLSFPLFMSLNIIGNLLGIGANSLTSRSLGKRMWRRQSGFPPLPFSAPWWEPCSGR